MEQPAIIIDIGSGTCKSGLSGSESPSLETPCLIGTFNDSVLIGQEVETCIGQLKIKCPVNNGTINDWEGIEKIFSNIFANLKISPENRDVLITDPLFFVERTSFEKKIYELFFEKFNVNSFKYECSSICALSAVGKQTGMIIDSGFDHTFFNAVTDGFTIAGQYINIGCAGDGITKYLIDKLKKKNIVDLSSGCCYKIAEDIKEKVCYVSQDYYGEIGSVEEMEYELPDGQVIKLKEERIECPEILFNLDLVGIRKEEQGLPFCCKEAIDMIDINKRKDMYSYLMITGGSTLFKGFETRFSKDIKSILPPDMAKRVNIEALPDRKYSVYKGASIMANSKEYRAKWINKKNYNEIK